MDEKMSLGELVSRLGQTHAELWAEEDKARVPDDHQVAAAKRRIDKLNQQRNDLVEKIDEWVIRFLESKKKGKRRG